MIRLFVFFILLIATMGTLCAERVILKNGERIEGDIVSKGKDSLILWGNRGVVVVRYEDIREIERPEKKEVESRSTEKSVSTLEKADGLAEKKEATDVKKSGNEPDTTVTPQKKEDPKESGPGQTARYVPEKPKISDKLQKEVDKIASDFHKGKNRWDPVKHLANKGDEVVPYLEYLLYQPSSANILEWIVASLKRIDSPISRQKLYLFVRFHPTDNKDILASAIEVLGKDPDPEIFELLKKSLESPHRKVKTSALSALGKSQNKEAIGPILSLYCQEKSPDLAGSAMRALLELVKSPQCARSAGSLILKLLNQEKRVDIHREKKLVELLGEIKYVKAFGKIREIFSSRPELFEAASVSLARMSTWESKELLTEKLGDVRETDQKIVLIKSFQHVQLQFDPERNPEGNEPFVDRLISLLEDPDPLVAKTALESLTTFSGKDFRMNPIGWKTWWKEFRMARSSQGPSFEPVEQENEEGEKSPSSEE